MKKAKGFTLIEVLFGLAVGSMVLVAAYASLKMGLRTYTKVNDQKMVIQNARMALSTISRDIRCVYDLGFKPLSRNYVPVYGSEKIRMLTRLPDLPDYGYASGGFADVEYYVDAMSGLNKTTYGGLPPFAIVPVTQIIAPLVTSINFVYEPPATLYPKYVTITIQVLSSPKEKGKASPKTQIFSTKVPFFANVW